MDSRIAPSVAWKYKSRITYQIAPSVAWKYYIAWKFQITPSLSKETVRLPLSQVVGGSRRHRTRQVERHRLDEPRTVTQPARDVGGRGHSLQGVP